MSREKEKRKQTSEIYITRENTDFFKTEDKELKKFYELVNQVLAINYGYWGAVWRNYIYENAPERYWIIKSERRLYIRIAEVDREAQMLYDRTVMQLKQKGVDHADRRAQERVLEDVIHNKKYFQ